MKIINNWKQAWRWYSVNCPMLAVALLGCWTALPAEMQAAFTPGELKMTAIVLILLGIGGRFIDQQKHGEPNDVADK